MQALQLGLTSLRSLEDITQLETALHFLIRRAAAIQKVKARAAWQAHRKAVKETRAMQSDSSSTSDSDTDGPAKDKAPANGTDDRKSEAKEGAESLDKDSTSEEEQFSEDELAVNAESQLFMSDVEKRMPSLARKV